MDTFGDFVRQVPIGLLIAPIFFGALYIGLMVVIFRRGAERRRRRATGETAPPPKRKSVRGNFFTGQLPDKPLEPAAWSVPVGLRGLPEPDLDMLSNPTVMPDEVQVETDAAESRTETKMDWLAMMAPAPQEIVVTTTKLPEPDKNRKTIDLGDAVEVMRVWRDLSDGSLIIQMGEQRYRSVNEISSPDLSRRFAAVVRELWVMINGGTAPRTVLPGQEPPMVGAGVPPPEGSTGGMKGRIGLLNQPAEAEENKARPGLLRQVTRTALGQTPTPPAPEARRDGIADAVEEYLQFKLSNTPQFLTRSIHVRPAVDGGVRIEVDGHYYDGVGDVIDADVRDFMFTVLREWEARQ